MTKYVALLFVAFVGCNNNPERILGSAPPIDIVLADPTSFDSAQWPAGQYILQSAALEGDILSLRVRCSTQSPADFQLVAWNYWLESNPVQVYAFLSFQPDTVNAGAAEVTVAFNLAPLKEAYRAAYQTQSGVIRFHVRYLEPSRAELRYEF